MNTKQITEKLKTSELSQESIENLGGQIDNMLQGTISDIIHKIRIMQMYKLDVNNPEFRKMIRDIVDKNINNLFLLMDNK